MLGYYRQFEDLDPEEVNRGLRERAARDKAVALAEVPELDLTSTEWAERPHPEVVAAAVFAARRGGNRYPDPRAGALTAALARRHAVAAEQIVVGNGASELLQAAALTLLGSGTELVTPWPSWPLYPLVASRAGARPVAVPLTRDTVDPAAVHDAVGPQTRLVVLCNPNDPTGTHLPVAQLDALLGALPEHVHVLLDEAYVDFCEAEPPESAVGLLARHPRLVVLRTFSKAHGLAGYRCGYAIGARGAPLLESLGPVLGVSAPTQAAVGQALELGDAELHRRRRLVAEQRARVLEALHDLPFEAPVSQGNFLWLRAGGLSGEEIAARLGRAKVRVALGRPLGDPEHVRVAVRDAHATDRLVDALAAAAH